MQSRPNPAVPVPASFAACHAAWLLARRGKKAGASQTAFASRWLHYLQQLHQDLVAGTWLPRRTVSFVVTHPKTREVHAPDFADRIVHHLLVPRLEALYEPVFIYDSYANRRGKGSHAAVDRLQAFMRQRDGRGWFLQLDVHNFFNRIHRPTLYALLRVRLDKAERSGRLPAPHALALRSLCHKLLAQPVRAVCLTPQAAQQVPAHKRLCHARPGCGLPIGNLSSQFFANVYLNELDQFVKHTLKVRHYVRYVDDFVLMADDAAQLRHWQARIEWFLQQRLRLDLKAQSTLAPLARGVDFLGYVVWAQHRRVRQRVVAHCCRKLQQWAGLHVRRDLAGRLRVVRASAEQLAALRAMLGSYWGHFAHADSHRLRQQIVARFDWLPLLFALRPDGSLAPRWLAQGCTLGQQVQALQREYPDAVLWVQKGWQWLCMARPQAATLHLRVAQTGWLRHGTRRREVLAWRWLPADAPPP